jgi:pyruvate formate lyase activating enzyme
MLQNIMKIPEVNEVYITGGEPTIQVKPLIELCKKLKERKIKVTLDTNGYYPGRIKRLMHLDLLDYIVMDVKAPLNERYSEVCGKDIDIKRIEDSLELISRSKVAVEVRTTIVPSLIDRKSDILSIAATLKNLGFGRYVIQQFSREGGTLDKRYEKYEAPSRDYLLDIAKEVKHIIKDVKIRLAIDWVRVGGKGLTVVGLEERT